MYVGTVGGNEIMDRTATKFKKGETVIVTNKIQSYYKQIPKEGIVCYVYDPKPDSDNDIKISLKPIPKFHGSVSYYFVNVNNCRRLTLAEKLTRKCSYSTLDIHNI